MRRAQPALPRAFEQRGVIAMHVGVGGPALDRDANEIARLDVWLQYGVGEALAGAEVVGNPARLRHAKRAHGAQDLFAPYFACGERRKHRLSDLFEHAAGEIVDALEVFAPANHQFTEREPRLEPALFV